MNALLKIAVVAFPILGCLGATGISWIVYPERPMPADSPEPANETFDASLARINADYAARSKVISLGMQDAEARLDYLVWGLVAGSTLGVLCAITLYVRTREPATRATAV